MELAHEKTPEYEILFHSPYVFATVTQYYYSKTHTLIRFARLTIRDYQSAWLSFYTDDDYSYDEYILDLAANLHKDYEEIEADTGRIISIGYRYKRFEISLDFVIYINAAISQMIPIEQKKLLKSCDEIGQRDIRAIDFLFGQYAMKIDHILNDPMDITQDRNPNIVAKGFEGTGVVIREALKTSGRFTGHMIRYLGRKYTSAAVATNGKPRSTSQTNPTVSMTKDTSSLSTESANVVEGVDTHAHTVDQRLIDNSLQRKQWAESVNSGAKTITGTVLFPVRYTGRIASKFATDRSSTAMTGPLHFTTTTTDASPANQSYVPVTTGEAIPPGQSSVPMAPPSSLWTSTIRRGSETSNTLSNGVVVTQNTPKKANKSSYVWDTVGGIGNGAASIFKGITEAMAEMGNAISDAAMHHAKTIHSEEYANTITKNNLDAAGEISIASYRLINVFALGLSGLMIDAMIEGTCLYVSLYDYLLGPILLQGYMPMIHLPLTEPTMYYVVLRPWSIAFYHSARDLAGKPFKTIPTAMLDTLPKLRIIDSILAITNNSTSTADGLPQADMIASTEAYYGGRYHAREDEESESNTYYDALDELLEVRERSDSQVITATATAEEGSSGDRRESMADAVEAFETGDVIESEGVGYIVSSSRPASNTNNYNSSSHNNSNSNNNTRRNNNTNTSSSARPTVVARVIEPMEVEGNHPIPAATVPAATRTSATNTLHAIATKSSRYMHKKQKQMQTILSNWNGGKHSHIEITTVDCSSYLLYPPLITTSIPRHAHHGGTPSSKKGQDAASTMTVLELWYEELSAATHRVETIAKRKSGSEELAMLRRMQSFIPTTKKVKIVVKRYIHTIAGTATSNASAVKTEETQGNQENEMNLSASEMDLTAIYGQPADEEFIPAAPISTNKEETIIPAAMMKAISVAKSIEAEEQAAEQHFQQDMDNSVMSSDVDYLSIYNETSEETVQMKSPFQVTSEEDITAEMKTKEESIPAKLSTTTAVAIKAPPSATTYEQIEDSVLEAVENTKESIAQLVEFTATMSTKLGEYVTSATSSAATAVNNTLTNTTQLSAYTPLSIRIAPKTYNGVVVQEEKKVTVPSNVYRRDEYIQQLQAYLQFVQQHGRHLPMMQTEHFRATLEANIALYARINEYHLFSEWEYYFPALDIPSTTTPSTAESTTAAAANTAASANAAMGDVGITENPMMAMKRKKQEIDKNIVALSIPVNTFVLGEEYGLFQSDDCSVLEFELIQYNSLFTPSSSSSSSSNRPPTSPSIETSYQTKKVIGLGQVLIDDVKECLNEMKDIWVPIFPTSISTNNTGKKTKTSSAEGITIDDERRKQLGTLLIGIQFVDDDTEEEDSYAL